MILAKGTTVKHGTINANLQSILEKGILPNSNRTNDRNLIEEKPLFSGVYVGQTLAYAAAYREFAANCKRMMENKGKPTFPIELNIEIMEDVELYPDEDYINKRNYKNLKDNDIKKQAFNIWNKYETGCINRAILSSWIQEIEFPEIITNDDEKKGTSAKSIMQDIEVFCYSYFYPSFTNPQKEKNELCKC